MAQHEYAIGEDNALESKTPWCVLQLVQGIWYPITHHATMSEALAARDQLGKSEAKSATGFLGAVL